MFELSAAIEKFLSQPELGMLQHRTASPFTHAIMFLSQPELGMLQHQWRSMLRLLKLFLSQPELGMLQHAFLLRKRSAHGFYPSRSWGCCSTYPFVTHNCREEKSHIFHS